MLDRLKFRIAVFERHNNLSNWVFKEYIEDDNHWFLNTCGDVCSLGCYSAHYRRDNAPDSVNRVYEVQFCTGLKDKNGKLIYEGDIVRLFCDEFENIHTVKFGDFAMYSLDFQTEYEKGSTAVYGYYLGGLKYPIPLSISLDTSGMQIEVIGNIYENKELLNE